MDELYNKMAEEGIKHSVWIRNTGHPSGVGPKSPVDIFLRFVLDEIIPQLKKREAELAAMIQRVRDLGVGREEIADAVFAEEASC